MELVGHPLVAGPGNAGVVLVQNLSLFTDSAADSPIPSYLGRPEAMLRADMGFADHLLHALTDAENAHSAPAQTAEKLRILRSVMISLTKINPIASL